MKKVVMHTHASSLSYRVTFKVGSSVGRTSPTSTAAACTGIMRRWCVVVGDGRRKALVEARRRSRRRLKFRRADDDGMMLPCDVRVGWLATPVRGMRRSVWVRLYLGATLSYYSPSRPFTCFASFNYFDAIINLLFLHGTRPRSLTPWLESVCVCGRVDASGGGEWKGDMFSMVFLSRHQQHARR